MKSPRYLLKPKKPKFPLLLRRVHGESMNPTLSAGQIVIGWSQKRPLKANDVAIFYHAGREKIKRVSKVKQGHYYFVGDNERASTDSRQFGYVHMATVRAKVIWPRI